ncbi:olfactory receptor 52L1-like [Tachyglossus aculeatus]|uniref:olfactory receptor 52L1-like n=1 Tax=Tachyglossus aculeatus TaxID=9261 RepID=UPI0018F5F657|nr:olfactory receptor 52L1-like [Tachyglossus aculeatus]
MTVASSNSSSRPWSFFLIGIPGIEDIQCWVAVPFCIMYILALLGNNIILFTIKIDPTLHQPMYLFLAMLSIIDLVLSTSTVPKMLAILWTHTQEMEYHTCLIQMFFIHSFSSMESGILVAMALDRFVAICHPLRHTAILNTVVIGRIGLVVLGRGLVLIMPFPILLQWLSFCQGTVVAHSYCEHMALVKLSCSDSIVNRFYGLMVALLVVGLDVLAIAASYILILRAVFRIPSRDARFRAMGTCCSHICIILMFYIPGMFSFLTHRFGHNIPHHVHILLATLYLLVPPAFNPVIYGIKTKQIRQRVLRAFSIHGQS